MNGSILITLITNSCTVLIIFLHCITNVYAQCNGSNLLCNKSYNEVAYLTTHNAFNSTEDGFNLPNQNLNITSQLNAGVRGLMLDVYDLNGIPTVYHGISTLGSKPLLIILEEINDFLEANDKEIVTIILESYTSASAIENVLYLANLSSYVYIQDSSASVWPTLQTMINDNTRLVVFSDVDDAISGQEWYHYVWDYAVETNYSANSVNDFNCDFNRGDSLNDLFILNHFITTIFGVGDQNEAATINANPFFIDRANQCIQEKGKFPNFVTIDFFELGDGLEVVNELNQLNPTNINSTNINHTIKIFPNPTAGYITIEGDKVELKSIQIYNMLSQELSINYCAAIDKENNVSIDLSELNSGIYIIKTATLTANFFKL